MSYEWDLDIQLEGCVQSFQDARDKHWSSVLTSEEWSALNQLRRDADEIAASIRKRAMALKNVGGVSEINAIHQAYLHEKNAAEDRYAELEAIARAKLPPELAEDIRRAFRSMLDKEVPDPEERTDRPLHLIWEWLCTEDARDSIAGIRDRVRRVFRLERLIADVLGKEEPPAASVEFLTLV